MCGKLIVVALAVMTALGACYVNNESQKKADDNKVESPRAIVGPIVGHVSSITAKLWFRPAKGAVVTLEVTPTVEHLPQFVPNEERNGIVIVNLDGLQPETRYSYQFSIGGTNELKWGGSFRTASIEADPTKFRMAFSSCLKPKTSQSSWYLLMAQRPDFHLLLGDNVYSNSTKSEKIWSRHVRMRSLPEFAAVLRSTPTYAMWDDHDYGPDNSDGTLQGKEESLRTFTEVWPNPSAGTEDIKGAFYEFSRGDVDFFVLDERYHRSPNSAPNDDNKRMLGDEQFEWLKNRLLRSKAKFKVLASGSTFGSNSKDDDWRAFDFSRKRLFRLISDERIDGVIYLSGDIHKSKIKTHKNNEGTGSYDLIEIISSGITNSDSKSFVTLDFDTTREDPQIEIRLVYGDATVPKKRTILLSELQAPEK